MFFRLLISKSQVTRLAAIQLVMMQAMTSLILRVAFSRPGIAPHRAPASTPPRKAMNQMSQAGTLLLGMESARNREAVVPARYWPGAPILNRPVLKATATETPVRMSGVARNSMLPILVGLKPKVKAPAASRPVLSTPKSTSRMPSHAPFSEISGLKAPTIRMTTAPVKRPMRMEMMEARSE